MLTRRVGYTVLIFYDLFSGRANKRELFGKKQGEEQEGEPVLKKKKK